MPYFRPDVAERPPLTNTNVQYPQPQFSGVGEMSNNVFNGPTTNPYLDQPQSHGSSITLLQNQNMTQPPGSEMEWHSRWITEYHLIPIILVQFKLSQNLTLMRNQEVFNINRSLRLIRKNQSHCQASDHCISCSYCIRCGICSLEVYPEKRWWRQHRSWRPKPTS